VKKIYSLLLGILLLCGCADEIFIFHFDKQPKWNHKEYSFKLDKDEYEYEYKGVWVTRIVDYKDGTSKTNTVYTPYLGVWRDNQDELDYLFESQLSFEGALDSFLNPTNKSK